MQFIRYLSMYIDMEWKAIQSMNKGKGVVLASTWVSDQDCRQHRDTFGVSITDFYVFQGTACCRCSSSLGFLRCTYTRCLPAKRPENT